VAGWRGQRLLPPLGRQGPVQALGAGRWAPFSRPAAASLGCPAPARAAAAELPPCLPRTQAYLNGIDIPGIFLFKTLVGKILGSIGAVAGGLAIGKEGPFVHAGAAVGALLCQASGGAGPGPGACAWGPAPGAWGWDRPRCGGTALNQAAAAAGAGACWRARGPVAERLAGWGWRRASTPPPPPLPHTTQWSASRCACS
jgi:hypothetical protein